MVVINYDCGRFAIGKSRFGLQYQVIMPSIASLPLYQKDLAKLKVKHKNRIARLPNAIKQRAKSKSRYYKTNTKKYCLSAFDSLASKQERAEQRAKARARAFCDWQKQEQNKFFADLQNAIKKYKK